MIKGTINFDDKKVNKKAFHKNKIWYGSIKYFVGYNDENVCVTRPLCVKFPQMVGYVKNFDGNKMMSSRVNYKKMLKKIIKYGIQLLIYWMCNLIVILFMLIMKNILRPK